MAPPLLKQYQEIKRQYREELLLFRMGDFYELFFDDAKIAAEALGIALTSKPIGKERIPLAGIPVKAADGYISRLLERGYKVAICEQIGTAQGRGLMERQVVEVITPGTVLLPSLLEDKKRSSIGAWCPLRAGGEEVACAICDITTGDFVVFKGSRERAVGEFNRWSVKEIVVPEQEEAPPGFNVTRIPSSYFDAWDREEYLMEIFGVSTLQGFGVERDSEYSYPAYALLRYLKEKKGNTLPPLSGIQVINLGDRMFLDLQTLRNLEITERIRPGEGMTLFEILDDTKTPMGGRLLRQELESPYTVIRPIVERLSRVNDLVQQPMKLEALKSLLAGIGDLERISTRVAAGKGNPRDFLRIGEGLQKIPPIVSLLKSLDSFQDLVSELDDLGELRDEIQRTIVEDPPASINEGGVIRDGVDPELDEYRSLARNSKARLLQIERKERARTGIASLKVGYNSVFGYYIEVTKPNLKFVPPDYIRKQTLSNAERFITEELKELERRILSAEEMALVKEKEHLERLREIVRINAKRMHALCMKLAEIDLAQSLASVAVRRKYVKPEIVEDDVLEIEEGRHPVVEAFIDEPFVPNDISMGEDRIFILTGPNMSGKSTYLRQIALIVIMAQIGSFVPARRAKIGVVDRVFSRIGASDDLARGVSTFMAEMIETAQILNQATRRSLVILDEVGRGTSTFDGMAIAWAVLEYLAKKIRAKTIFATHYQELSSLEGALEGIRNFTIMVKEWGGGVVFLRKVVRGTSDKSYGIHVAKLAGLPAKVIKRAKEVLKEVESRSRPVRYVKQLSFFEKSEGGDSDLRKRIVSLNLDEMTPKEALDFLYKLKEALER